MTTKRRRDGERQAGETARKSGAERVAALLFFLFFVYFWAFRYGNFLFVVQNFALFPPNGEEFRETAFEPGGALEIATLFFAQILYFPLVGGALLAGTLAMIRELAARFGRALDLSPNAVFYWSFLPPTFAALLFVGLDLNVFGSTAGTFYLAPTFGLLGLFAVVAFLSRFENRGLRRKIAVAVAAGAFPIFGVFSFLFPVFLIKIESIRHKSQRKNVETEPQNAPPTSERRQFWRFAATLTLIAAVAPLLWGAIFYPNFSAPRLYGRGLFSESAVAFGTSVDSRQTGLYFALLAATLAGAALPKRSENRRNDAVDVKSAKEAKLEKKTDRKLRAISAKHADANAPLQPANSPPNADSAEKRAVKRPPTETLWIAFLALAFVAAAPRDANFFATTALVRPFDAGNWTRILETETKVKNPTSTSISLRRLALFKRGELAERAFERPCVGAANRTLERVTAHRIFGDRVLYSWGFVNLARRDATNLYAATQGRSVWATKTLLLSALEQREFAAAERFARRLERSVFHRRWVAKYRPYLEFCVENAISAQNAAAIFADAPPEIADVEREFDEIRRLEPRENYIETDLTSPDLIVLLGLKRDPNPASLAVSANGATVKLDATSRAVVEARLVAALSTFDLPKFAAEIDDYRRALGGERLPKAFQEAALVAKQTGFLENVDDFRFDPEILARFDGFSRLYDAYRRAGSSAELALHLRVGFENTAWHYLLLNSGNEWY